MRILVVGGGGREHALCWAISASPLCTKLYCAPGNAGIAQVAACIDVAAEDIAGQVALARRVPDAQPDRVLPRRKAIYRQGCCDQGARGCP